MVIRSDWKSRIHFGIMLLSFQDGAVLSGVGFGSIVMGNGEWRMRDRASSNQKRCNHEPVQYPS